MAMIPEALIAALILVESAGNPAAVGDGGRALGCLQIHSCVVQDVNRRYGAAFRHQDALDPARAREICSLYIYMHAPPGASLETMARIWNGGPRGHRRSATLPYWRKVQAALAPIAKHPTGKASQ